MIPTPVPTNDQAAMRRARARRMALWLAVFAVGVYVAFLLTGVLGR